MGRNLDLIVHIGTHKSGSTTIQNFLRENSDYLLDNHGLKFIDLNDYDFLYKLMTAEAPENQIIQHLSSLLAEGVEKGIDKYIVSSEAFSGNPDIYYSNNEVIVEMLKKSTTLFNSTKIIVFLRRQDEFLQSLYIQKVQQGGSLKPDQFYQPDSANALDWNLFLEPFKNSFGKNNTHAIPYDRLLFSKHSISQPFLEEVGIDTSSEKIIPEKTENVSLSESALKIAMLANPSLDPHQQRLFREALQLVSNKGVIREHGVFDQELKMSIVNQYDQSNQKLAQEYFTKYQMSNFSEPIFSDSDNNIEEEIIKTFSLLSAHIISKQEELEKLINTKDKCFAKQVYRKLKKILNA